MAGYGFTSPGAAVQQAIEQILLRRELMKEKARVEAIAEQERQAKAQQQQADMAMRQQDMALRTRTADRADQEFAYRQQQDTAQAAEIARQTELAKLRQQDAAGVRQMSMTALNAGTAPGIVQRMYFGETGQALPPGIIDAAPKADDFTLSPGSIRYDATGKVIARAPTAGPGPDTRNPIAVIGPDGKPIFVRPSDAVGKTPASNREQGRPVTSGDANRITDLDTSLNDLDTLEQEIKGMTGTGSAIGAGLWNPITDLTGIGADSKKRQAVIDRVKQVIGKALEGGVLRKEDEAKYAKILPVIGDEPSVAAAKLEGLRKAIEQRRGTSLDSLDDAGYDVAEYRKRQRGGGDRVMVIAPDGKRGTIPVSQLQDALAQGYKRAE